MNKNITTRAVFVLLIMIAVCRAGGCVKDLATCQRKAANTDAVETILTNLSRKAAELKSYQCQIEYRFSQPILESKTLRKGVLYYKKAGEKTKLRINFQTLKQDDEEEQKYVEQYIFDGLWLTHIDYQIKEVKKHQLAEPNEPIDAFELVSRNFPIIGFTKIEDLKKEFEITLVKQKPGESHSVIPAKAGIHDFVRLHLKVKPDSIYKDDYTYIDIVIDKALSLPHGIFAMSVEEDIYAIRLRNARVNEEINEKVFELKIPKGFGVEITPLNNGAN